MRLFVRLAAVVLVATAIPAVGAGAAHAGGSEVASAGQCSDGTDWKIVEGLDINDFSREKIDGSVDELKGERDTVQDLGLI